MFYQDGQIYVDEVFVVQVDGFVVYKFYLLGNLMDEDFVIYIVCCEVVGDFGLMLDFVFFMIYFEVLCYGCWLEEFNYFWFEELIQNENIFVFKVLIVVFDILVVGIEILVKYFYLVVDCILFCVVDVVCVDVSWLGGVMVVLKIVVMVEVFGMNCEIYIFIFYLLELVNLYFCGVMKNCSYLEFFCLIVWFDFGLVELLLILEGIVWLFEIFGFGVEFDWVMIDQVIVWCGQDLKR